MVIRDVCPQCQSPQFKKNGHIHNGKQNHHCHDCGRQFVQCYEQYLIAQDKRRLIERLLLERLSVARWMSPSSGFWAFSFSVLRSSPIICMSNLSPVSMMCCSSALKRKPMK